MVSWVSGSFLARYNTLWLPVSNCLKHNLENFGGWSLDVLHYYAIVFKAKSSFELQVASV